MTDHLRELTTRARLGVITDMDGTISPIALTPDSAVVTPRSRDLLRQLHQRVALVAVVSGRAVADVRERVGLPELVYVGNHGLERWRNGKIDVVPEAVAVRPVLSAAAAELRLRLLPGMLIEDKGVTLAIHYRLADDPAKAQAVFTPLVRVTAEAHGLAAFEGKMIFELRPPVKIDKGTTFRRLVAEYQLDAAVYLGDDTTDADALRTAQGLRQSGTCYALAVGVESDETPEPVRAYSDVLVSGVAGVENWLETLLNALSAS
jgi:trehalose 6-phosphate phosphatase